MKRFLALLLAAAMCLSLLCTAAFADTERTLTASEDWTIITVDPGHGGNGGGGYRWNGKQYNETELVLKIAYYLKAELESYYHVKVVLTRTTNSQEEYDKVYEISTRGDIAEKYCSDLFISLHLNGSSKANSARGACVLVPNGNYRPELAEKDCQLARYILAELNALGIPSHNGGLLVRDSETRPPETNPDGTVADYYGIVRTGLWRNILTVLVEHCYMDSYSDAINHLSSEEQLRELAVADANAIAKYFKLQKKADIQPDPDSGITNTGDNDYCLYDYRSHWAHEAIDKAVVSGWVKGYGDDSFRPNNNVTRGQFVTFLGRAADIDLSQYEGHSFEDVAADSFCAKYVQWASENGIVNGYEDGLFRPERNITREQIAKIMTRFLAYCGFDVSGEFSIEDFEIADADTISDWADEYVAFCYAKKLLLGKNGSFEPKRTATRAEACTVLVRMMDYDGPMAGDEPVIPEEPETPEEPEIPEEPETPEEPEIPEEPVTPEEPVIPEEPEIPEEPVITEE